VAVGAAIDVGLLVAVLAAAARAAARALVKERAARISDPQMRTGYLEKVPANARVLRDTP
jgi:hypothetical protein